ncbi:MAG: IS1/IS1595 family N-terminal zinc-binding domain-containing protein, partial [Candidatus Norongarragalinales archaeon]
MEGNENSDIQCPQCGSKRLYRDGLRYLADGSTVQRWLCRECGYRFSETSINKLDKFQHVQKVQRQILNSPDGLTLYCQGSCEAFPGRAPTSLGMLVKTLAEVESRSEKRAAGATVSPVDVKGKILEFLWHLKRQGRKETTIKSYAKVLTSLSKQVDILQPEAVKDYLAKATISETSKSDYTKVLRAFYKYLNLQWQAPNYKPVE